MKPVFEELDYQETPLGDISLRRRSDPRLNNKILYEVKLNDEFLMSSLFVEAEEQLTTLGLATLKDNGHTEALDIIVGGLGLGYTALKVLEDPAVNTMGVIDVMAAVIRWHQLGLIPIGDVLATDPRSTLIQGDFFKIATAADSGFDNDDPSKKVHGVLLDIDHSPSNWLNDGNRDFYTEASLQSLADKLHPGGVFGIWSTELPDQKFSDLLNTVFEKSEAHTIPFANPYTGGESFNSVYVASKAL